MQTRTFYGCSCQSHWLKVCYWSYRSCSPYLVADTKQFGYRLLSLIFIRDCPSGRFRSKTQLLLLCIFIYLDYDSVNLKIQIITGCIPVINKFENLIYTTYSGNMIRHLKTPLLCCNHICIMTLVWQFLPQNIIKITV